MYGPYSGVWTASLILLLPFTTKTIRLIAARVHVKWANSCERTRFFALCLLRLVCVATPALVRTLTTRCLYLCNLMTTVAVGGNNGFIFMMLYFLMLEEMDFKRGGMQWL